MTTQPQHTASTVRRAAWTAAVAAALGLGGAFLPWVATHEDSEFEGDVAHLRVGTPLDASNGTHLGVLAPVLVVGSVLLLVLALVGLRRRGWSPSALRVVGGVLVVAGSVAGSVLLVVWLTAADRLRIGGRTWAEYVRTSDADGDRTDLSRVPLPGLLLSALAALLVVVAGGLLLRAARRSVLADWAAGSTFGLGRAWPALADAPASLAPDVRRGVGLGVLAGVLGLVGLLLPWVQTIEDQRAPFAERYQGSWLVCSDDVDCVGAWSGGGADVVAVVVLVVAAVLLGRFVLGLGPRFDSVSAAVRSGRWALAAGAVAAVLVGVAFAVAPAHLLVDGDPSWAQARAEKVRTGEDTTYERGPQAGLLLTAVAAALLMAGGTELTRARRGRSRA